MTSLVKSSINFANSSCLSYYIKSVPCAQSCLTLCGPMEYSLPGSSVCGIIRARILEWDAVYPSLVDLVDPGIGTHVSYVSCIWRLILYHWAAWKTHVKSTLLNIITLPDHFPQTSLMIWIIWTPEVDQHAGSGAQGGREQPVILTATNPGYASVFLAFILCSQHKRWLRTMSWNVWAGQEQTLKRDVS